MYATTADWNILVVHNRKPHKYTSHSICWWTNNSHGQCHYTRVNFSNLFRRIHQKSDWLSRSFLISAFISDIFDRYHPRKRRTKLGPLYQMSSLRFFLYADIDNHSLLSIKHSFLDLKPKSNFSWHSLYII